MKRNKECSLCSGYGVFPDGSKCKGCSDCEGRFLKKGATPKQLREIFDQNHAVIHVSKNTTGEEILCAIETKIKKRK